MAAHRTQQPSRPAADFESPPGTGRYFRGKPLQFRFQFTDNIRGGGEKFVVILTPPSEGYKVVGVLARALVPFGAHALVNFHTTIVARRYFTATGGSPLEPSLWKNFFLTSGQNSLSTCDTVSVPICVNIRCMVGLNPRSSG